MCTYFFLFGKEDDPLLDVIFTVDEVKGRSIDPASNDEKSASANPSMLTVFPRDLVGENG